MICKNGFFLTEILVGLSITFFFIFIIAHYTIYSKNIQHNGIKRMELLLVARNCAERLRSGYKSSCLCFSDDSLSVTIHQKDISLLISNTNASVTDKKFTEYDIQVTGKTNNRNVLVKMPVYLLANGQ